MTKWILLFYINGVLQTPLQFDTQERCEKQKRVVNAIVFNLSDAQCYVKMIPLADLGEMRW